MDWTWFLFSFDGRINRARCWLAGLIIISWIIFLSLVFFGVAHLLGAIMPESVNLGPNEIFNIVDPKAWRSLSSANFTALFIQTVGTPLFLWVYAATSVKRLHDRDKSGWWMVPFFVVPGLYNQFADRLPDSYLVLPLAGPSNARDATGLMIDYAIDPFQILPIALNVDWFYYSAPRYALTVVDYRSRTMFALDDLEKNSVDYYAALRSAYTQNRAELIRAKREKTDTKSELERRDNIALVR